MTTLSIKDYSKHTNEIRLICLRFYEWALNNNMNSLRIVIADGQYYNKTLEQRQLILNSPSIEHLCKTIIFENTAYNEKFFGEYYPKYIAVMVQYVAKINTEKLNKEIKLWQNSNSSDKAGKQFFHFRLLDEAQSCKMTGYEHNGVVPILMQTKMPIVFSDSIEKLNPQFFWMGGGHPWIKMRASLQEFKKVYDDKLIIRDITY